jgi:hypothetical protein
MEKPFLKRMVNAFPMVGLATALSSSTRSVATSSDTLPTKEKPLLVDEVGQRVLIYTEVNEKNLHETNPHWGIVFKDGTYGHKAILRSYASQLALHDALLWIGAKPGDNLTKETLGAPVEGDRLEIAATWPGLGKERKLEDIFHDEAGKGFEIRFGGNRKAAELYNTGCITCLESCWIAITSNAKYPNISPLTRAESPNSRFRGRSDVLPGGDQPVILIYRVAGGS